MCNKVSRAVWEHSKSKRGALSVLLKIADNADADGYAFPGQNYLADKTNLSRRSVYSAIQKLVKAGELEVVCKPREDHPKCPLSVRVGRGYQPTHLYKINLPGLTDYHPIPASAEVKKLPLSPHANRGEDFASTEGKKTTKQRCSNFAQTPLKDLNHHKDAHRAKPARSADKPSASFLSKEITERLLRIQALHLQHGKDALAWVKHAAREGCSQDVILDALGALMEVVEEGDGDGLAKAWAWLEKTAERLEHKSNVQRFEAEHEQRKREEADYARKLR